MLALTETIIAFAVIMLMLSFLVKSLTSVIKNCADYYSQNLRAETERLIYGYRDCAIKVLWDQNIGMLDKIEWRRLSEEYLTQKNLEWVLIKLGVDKGDLNYLESRLELHRANVRYAFETRTKNISLALGMALCLALNINAVTIWQTLYNDQAIRGQLSTTQMIEEMEKRYQAMEAAQKDKNPDLDKVAKEDLKKKIGELTDELKQFEQRVPFGVGRLWGMPSASPRQHTDQEVRITAPRPGLPDKDKPADKTKEVPKELDWKTMLYEFLGSLLTGILLSVGAPYWHDLLRAMSGIRPMLGGRGKMAS